MKSLFLIILLMTCLFHFAVSQEKLPNLPYYEIPSYPESYTAGTVAARVVDGLGFRYYWATEGLRPEDLAYKPSAEARTTEETLVHIYNLTLVLANATKKVPTVTGGEQPKLSFAELRKGTLENIKTASDILKRSSEKDLQSYNMKFTGARTSDFPFWNLLNGPIDDALWHVGQVITFRRSSGNPFNGNANVLIGKFVEQKNAPANKE
ncbi:MAG TPA: hypothetical protein VFU05_17765 [Cyclobacteriaceae bacterium]|nr:hypothetical protein [Cyclobacteriaceae bacterium]